tara:strand:- start:1202 stop:1948 length:747 start_codon:yes stop_codon:yes gene_type:complete
MRHPLLFSGNYLLTTPELLEVVDFKAWRKVANPTEDRKRRRFSPYLTLRTGDVLLKLVGYTAVWEFLDAIQPQLPRIPINSVMKGYDFYDEETLSFLEEVSWFIIESPMPFIAFKIDENGLARAIKKPLQNVPINSKEYTGVAELTMYDGGKYYSCLLETVKTRYNKKQYFCYLLGYGIRPLQGVIFSSIDEAQRYSIAISEELDTTDIENYKLNIRHGMFDEEIDKLENELFFQLISELQNHNSASQ